MERDEAREHWKRSGLTYEILTKASLHRLRNRINAAMRASGCLRGTFRANQRFSIRYSADGKKWADLKCKAFYFEDRQAVTFEPYGFIGFAGWADAENVQPILSAFCAWVDEMAASAKGQIEKRSAERPLQAQARA